VDSASTAKGSDDSGRVTRLLRRAGEGDAQASSELLEAVYDELRDLAGRLFARAGGAPTLQPTALVHDAFLKLVDREEGWNDRQHFFAVASVAMRHLLRDGARARAAQKRGGAWERVSLSDVRDTPGSADFDLVELDTALDKLSRLSERQGRVVELRFFTGLAVKEIAELLGVSVATVGNEWRAARAFLSRELRGAES